VPELPADILSQLVSLPHEAKLAQAHITAKDLAPDETVPWGSGGGGGLLAGAAAAVGLGGGGGDGMALQYWPESISDTRESVWNPRYIPGGSHPIYQWTHGGERRISFTSVFTADTAPEEDSLKKGKNPYGLSLDLPLSGIDKSRDVDIRAAIGWLRYFTYPLYPEGEDVRAYEPPKAELFFPNSAINVDGTDSITCVMTRCDVTYEDFFPSGFPRLAEVALEFAEVVQFDKKVAFQGRKVFEEGPASYVGDFLSLKTGIL
jgi:hypothetical protein